MIGDVSLETVSLNIYTCSWHDTFIEYIYIYIYIYIATLCACAFLKIYNIKIKQKDN